MDKSIRMTHYVKHVDYVTLKVQIGADSVDPSSSRIETSENEYYSTMFNTVTRTHVYQSSLHDKQWKREYYDKHNSPAMVNLAVE
jgi:hypothetical protein